MPLDESLYELLEVSPRACAAVIKAAYRCLVQLHHPDKHAGDPVAVERLARINHAYAVLSNLDKRAQYDAAAGHIQPVTDRRGGAAKTRAVPPAGQASGPKRAASRAFAFRPLNEPRNTR